MSEDLRARRDVLLVSDMAPVRRTMRALDRFLRRATGTDGGTNTVLQGEGRGLHARDGQRADETA